MGLGTSVRTPRSAACAWARAALRVGVKSLSIYAVGLSVCASLGAQTPQAAPDLSDISLEQLATATISVSSSARKDEDLWLTPAAVYVIGREDIARSTATTIPELLRGVPGLQVAQINASYWAVTARGFNSEYASKLLVLIDGRTVYSEIYSGTHWDTIDMPLEDIERIEVIRGPGAAVWGTNAVNGVINIISKPTRETKGLLLSGRVGRLDDAGTLEYAGRMGAGVRYRGFVSYIDRRPFDLAQGGQAFDGAGTWRGGGSLMWQKSARDSVKMSGDVYNGHLRNQIVPKFAPVTAPDGNEYESVAGGFLLSRWEHKTERSQSALQVYYDDQTRNELDGSTRTRTTDLDFQSHHAAGAHHDLVWGGNFRFTADHIVGATTMTGRHDIRNYLEDAFLQDEITLAPHRLTLTVGTRVQDGTLAGLQVQPSARLLFVSSKAQTMWLALSRAGVAPSLQDKYLQLALTLPPVEGLPLMVTALGNPKFKTENVIAYEAGFRRRLWGGLAFDAAAFFNDSHRIQALETTIWFDLLPYPHLVGDLLYTNGFRALSGGIETALVWKPLPRLTLNGNYAWMEAHTFQVDPGAVTILTMFNAPRNQFTGTGFWNVGRGWGVGARLANVGALPIAPEPSADPTQHNLPGVLAGYTRVDADASWKVGRRVELGAGGTNLQAARHVEFDAGTGYVMPAYVPRSWFIKGTWSF
jgi:iron complex outermembrane recepter protein